MRQKRPKYYHVPQETKPATVCGVSLLITSRVVKREELAEFRQRYPAQLCPRCDAKS